MRPSTSAGREASHPDNPSAPRSGSRPATVGSQSYQGSRRALSPESRFSQESRPTTSERGVPAAGKLPNLARPQNGGHMSRDSTAKWSDSAPTAEAAHARPESPREGSPRGDALDTLVAHWPGLRGRLAKAADRKMNFGEFWRIVNEEGVGVGFDEAKDIWDSMIQKGEANTEAPLTSSHVTKKVDVVVANAQEAQEQRRHRQAVEASMRKLRTRLNNFWTSHGQSAKLAFRLLDTENDGNILISEAARLIKTLNLGVNDSEIHNLLRTWDKDGTGKIDYNQFFLKIAEEETFDGEYNAFMARSYKLYFKNEEASKEAERVATRPALTQKDVARSKKVMQALSNVMNSHFTSVTEAFRYLDDNKDGVVSNEEFKEKIKYMELDFAEDDIDTFIAWCDGNGNNFISLEEFIQKFNAPSIAGSMTKPKWLGGEATDDRDKGALELLNYPNSPTRQNMGRFSKKNVPLGVRASEVSADTQTQAAEDPLSPATPERTRGRERSPYSGNGFSTPSSRRQTTRQWLDANRRTQRQNMTHSLGSSGRTHALWPGRDVPEKFWSSPNLIEPVQSCPSFSPKHTMRSTLRRPTSTLSPPPSSSSAAYPFGRGDSPSHSSLRGSTPCTPPALAVQGQGQHRRLEPVPTDKLNWSAGERMRRQRKKEIASARHERYLSNERRVLEVYEAETKRNKEKEKARHQGMVQQRQRVLEKYPSVVETFVYDDVWRANTVS